MLKVRGHVWWSGNEIARILGLERATVSLWVLTKKLPATKLHKCLSIIKHDDAMKWLVEHNKLEYARRLQQRLQEMIEREVTR